MNIDSPSTPISENQTPDPNSDEIKANPAKTSTNGRAKRSSSGRSRPPKMPKPELQNEFFSWFSNNNPLYLLSVVLMLAALYLVSSEVEAGKTTVFTVCSFFAVQNLYELVMIGMALYLLKKHIQSDHGKLLLILVLVFLGDLTGYQVHIAGKDQYCFIDLHGISADKTGCCHESVKS